jgi:hypothetical protein
MKGVCNKKGVGTISIQKHHLNRPFFSSAPFFAPVLPQQKKTSFPNNNNNNEIKSQSYSQIPRGSNSTFWLKKPYHVENSLPSVPPGKAKRIERKGKDSKDWEVSSELYV